MDESIQGIIPNTQSCMLGQKAFNLIITDKRLIVATLTSDMIKQEAKRQAEESKAQGEGIFKRMAKTATAGTSLYKKYFDMTAEQILAEHADNYAIDPSMVKKIKVKQGYFKEHQSKRTPNELKIKTTDGKKVFRFSHPTAKEAKNMISQTFGL